MKNKSRHDTDFVVIDGTGGCHKDIVFSVVVSTKTSLMPFWTLCIISLQWRHNERDGVSNHRRLYCLLNRLFRRRSKRTSKLRNTGLCAGNCQVTGEFPAQRASNAEIFPFDDVIMSLRCITLTDFTSLWEYLMGNVSEQMVSTINDLFSWRRSINSTFITMYAKT